MKLLVLLPAIILAGCTTVVPVKQKFPEPVTELKERCPDLMQIQGDKVSITDMLKTIVQNYNTYYTCANKVEGWNEWYDSQKKVFENSNK